MYRLQLSFPNCRARELHLLCREKFCITMDVCTAIAYSCLDTGSRSPDVAHRFSLSRCVRTTINKLLR